MLYLARALISQLGSQQTLRGVIAALLFGGAGLAGALTAVAALAIWLRLTGRIRVIAKKAEALLPSRGLGSPLNVTDDLGALDAALGRLTLSVDKFVRDSDILSRLPEGMLLLLPTDELLSFNTTAEVLLDLPLERYRGVPLLASSGIFPLSKGNEAIAQLLREASTNQQPSNTTEVVATTSTGQDLLLEITVQSREWGADSKAVVMLFRDASEKQRIREEIKRADQLALLGGMAARVAHQIRTPLATIRGLLELLQTDLNPTGQRKEYMDRIIQAVDRQDRLVENLLTLSHAEPESCQAVPLPSLIDDVLDMPPADPRIRVSGTSAPPPAWGDAFRLSEVFTNLIQNALEATPSDGVVEVRMEAGPPGVVRATVRNTGTGLPAELRERIFQPFFTTKTRGTGLGLAIARQIVEAHRGRLDVISDGVSETTFIVDLPTQASPIPMGLPREEMVRGDRG